LADRHIVTIRAERGAGSDGRLTRVRWVVTADGNGRSANLRVRGTRGERDQSFTVPGPGASTHTTAWVDHGHSYTETVEVTLSDTGRGSRSRTATAPATADPPPPEVGVSRGTRCQDNNASLPDCNNGAPGNTDCTNSSCAHVVVSTSNFSGNVTCRLDSDLGPYANTYSLGANETRQLSAYFGGNWISATCSRTNQSATSGRYAWR
ncbi:hypothetical protein, partial [Nocardioides sp.]|uniref:hypothetical protein n=1 Tax=Nocardioides sp. TaxID=35761 RepID=UPI00273622E4